MPLFLVTTTFDRFNGVPGAKLVSAPYAAKAVELSGWVPQEAKATPIGDASAAGVLAEFNTTPAPESDDDDGDYEDDDLEDDDESA